MLGTLGLLSLIFYGWTLRSLAKSVRSAPRASSKIAAAASPSASAELAARARPGPARASASATEGALASHTHASVPQASACAPAADAASAAAAEAAAEEAELAFSTCCASAWDAALVGGVRELCAPHEGALAPSSFRCHFVPAIAPPRQQQRAAAVARPVWFCEGTRVALDVSAGWLARGHYATPTVSNRDRYPAGALTLRGCELDRAALAGDGNGTRDAGLSFGAGALSRILPGALRSEPEAAAAPALAAAERHVLTLLVVRMSPKNFYHGHFDVLHACAILLRVLGQERRSAAAAATAAGAGAEAWARPRVRIVLVPPDKANRPPPELPLRGPQMALWEALSDEPVRSALELARGQGGAALRPAADGRVTFGRVVLALSGVHSVSGRGPPGRALDAACGRASACARRARAAPLAQLPPFYRAAVGALLAHAHVLAPVRPPPSAAGEAGARVLWLTRGAGLGGGYARTVARRCVNEGEVLAAARARTRHTVDAADFGQLRFAEQLRLLRAADVLSGMHGAGFTNMCFARPGLVVLELCAMHYCPPMYEHMAAQLGMRHLRWRNTRAADDLGGDDTRVPPEAFVRALEQAAALVPPPLRVCDGDDRASALASRSLLTSTS